MKRRLVLTAGALVAALSLSSCSTFDHSDVAATVNGHELTRDQLDKLVEDSSGESLRLALSVWARIVILEGEDYQGVPESGQAANERLLGIVSGFGEEYYNQGPATTGLVCVSALVTNDEAGAEAAADALAAGTAFSDVFLQFNQNQALQPTGGVVTDDTTGSDCLAPDGFVPELSEPFTQLSIGEASAPIPFAGGFVVAFSRPWAEVSSASQQTFISSAGGPTTNDAVVEIAPRLGRWDPAKAAVVPTATVEPTAAG